MPQTATDAVQQAFANFATQQESARLNQVIQKIAFYEGDHQEYIEPYINRQEKDIPWSYTNITERVIRKRSQVYKNAPIRRFDNEINDKYQSLIGYKNRRMKAVERMSKLLGVVGIRPVADTDQKELRYHIIRQFLVPQIDPLTMHPSEVIYPIEGEDGKPYWVFWSATEHYVMDNDGVQVKDQESFGVNEDKSNPYGVIPFAFCNSSEMIDDFWVAGAEELVHSNILIDVALTDLNYAIRYNAFKQAYAQGQNLDAGELKIGYNKLMQLDGIDSEVGVLDLGTNLGQIVEAIKFQIQAVERNYDLTINWGIEGAPSGFSLMVQNIDLLQGWEDDIEIAREWESELYHIEQVVAKQDLGMTLPDAMQVDFAEVEFPVNPEEERNRYDWEIQHNISTPLDYMKDQSPDTDDAVLEQQLKDNVRKNKELRITGKASLEELAQRRVTQNA